MIAANLPILHVLLPLLAAPLCLLVRNGAAAWAISLLACWGTFLVSLALLAHSTDAPILYYLGGWAPPYGIEYAIDPFSALILVLVSGIASVVIPFAAPASMAEIPEEKRAPFFTVFLLCLAGLLGIASTNDVFNIYVFLEISSLATYALIAMGKDKRSVLSAFEYLILGTIGATFFLIGVGFLYAVTGTLNIDDLAQRLPEVQDLRPVYAAAAFITVGLALKIAMFPLHLWLTNAYTYAPSFISAFLAGTATKISLYVLFRILFNVFGIELSFGIIHLDTILFLFAFAGIIIGSLTAIFQENIKRMLAFSSVAQISYIVLGFSLVSYTGITAGVVHIFNHGLAKTALFLAVGSVFIATGGVSRAHFAGLGKAMPWTMGAFVLAGLSLIGVPGTAGFISKWHLVLGLIEQDSWFMVAVVLISSLLAVIYIWRVVEVAYFSPLSAKTKKAADGTILLIAPAWVLAIAGVYFGIDPSLPLGTAVDAAQHLIAGRP